MAHADSNELLAAALAQLGREQNTFTGPLPPIPTADDPYVLEEHPMNMSDQYEIYVDHEDDQRIKSRPIEEKKEIFIGPDGRPLPEDVQEQIRGYGSEDDSLSFLKSFLNDDMAFASPNPGPAPVRPGEVPTDPSSPYAPWKKSPHLAGVPYTLPDQQIFYETGGKVHQMPRPIKQDYDMERLIQSMKDRYRV